MKRFQNVYLEITNVCNLHCRFCPGTRRTPMRISEEAFRLILKKLCSYTNFLYFHVMGEPLCHPDLSQFLKLAQDYGFRVILTTNGTLLSQKRDILLNAPALHKINISLHAFEANDLDMSFSDYLDGCFSFGKAARGGPLVVYRLWNRGGADQMNGEILSAMARVFPKPWITERRGTRISNRVYLEYGERFDWPDLSAEENSGQLFCYGLRDQIGVLCDGTVVPCCLDHEGDIALGNLLSQSMEEILASPRAESLYDGFSRREAQEALCRRCGYALRFH